MLRGRIIAADGTKAEELKPGEGSAWVLRGDRGITYAPSLPAGSRLVAGEWWPADYSGPPLVSLERRTADDLKLKVGDTITVNVLGRNLTARIANLRAVDWQSLGINFVLVFSPGTFAGAPHTDIATLTFADGGSAAEETALVKALADAFPTVSAIRVKDALDTIDHLVGNLVLGLRGASSVALIAAALVLGGALAAGQRFRIYDAVILKTLGATRLRLVLAYAVEYLLIGLAAVIFGVAAGSVTAELVITRVMEFSFVWMAVPALATAVFALLATVLLGLVGTFSALGHKPAEVLRNL
jgi:putative ABC transport system permease protein